MAAADVRHSLANFRCFPPVSSFARNHGRRLVYFPFVIFICITVGHYALRRGLNYARSPSSQLETENRYGPILSGSRAPRAWNTSIRSNGIFCYTRTWRDPPPAFIRPPLRPRTPHSVAEKSKVRVAAWNSARLSVWSAKRRWKIVCFRMDTT